MTDPEDQIVNKTSSWKEKEKEGAQTEETCVQGVSSVSFG